MSLASPRNIDANTKNGTMAQHGDDNGLYVEFSMEAFHHPFKSEQEGRPVFEDRPFIKIFYPGDMTKRTERWVEDNDKDRFPRQWAAFQAQESTQTVGLAVTEWPPLTKSQAAELKAMNIHTVEQLAAVPDGQLAILGARDLINKAKSWLSQADSHVTESKMAAENSRLQAELDALKAQMADVVARTGKTEETVAGIKLKPLTP